MFISSGRAGNGFGVDLLNERRRACLHLRVAGAPASLLSIINFTMGILHCVILVSRHYKSPGRLSFGAAAGGIVTASARPAVVKRCNGVCGQQHEAMHGSPAPIFSWRWSGTLPERGRDSRGANGG